MIEAIALSTLVGVFIIFSYTLGLRNGQKLSKGREVELPNPNLVEVIKEQKEEKKVKAENKYEEDVFNTMMDNIDNYDGTGLGQKNIPNR